MTAQRSHIGQSTFLRPRRIARDQAGCSAASAREEELQVDRLCGLVGPHPAVVLVERHPQLAAGAGEGLAALRVAHVLALVVVDVEVQWSTGIEALGHRLGLCELAAHLGELAGRHGRPAFEAAVTAPADVDDLGLCAGREHENTERTQASGEEGHAGTPRKDGTRVIGRAGYGDCRGRADHQRRRHGKVGPRAGRAIRNHPGDSCQPSARRP